MSLPSESLLFVSFILLYLLPVWTLCGSVVSCSDGPGFNYDVVGTKQAQLDQINRGAVLYMFNKKVRVTSVSLHLPLECNHEYIYLRNLSDLSFVNEALPSGPAEY